MGANSATPARAWRIGSITRSLSLRSGGLGQVSVDTLRHDDTLGLLKPIEVDQLTGCRYDALDMFRFTDREAWHGRWSHPSLFRYQGS